MIIKYFNVYIVSIVVLNFRKFFSIFLLKFPGIFGKIFQHDVIPFYSMLLDTCLHYKEVR